MSQADFNKFLKLEKRLGKLIDNPTGSSSRALMKRKESLRRRLKDLEPKIKGFEDGGEVMNTTRAMQLNPITGEPI